ncbi:MAG: hypothetical protein M1825_005476 [Sarcosagium campestre]|nr:MAG: hypothetical protein M1825_005476 [Sarcosagium campestre]
MAEAGLGGESTHPNLNLSQEEKRFFGQLFQAADTENVGVITGEVAVKFFERTKLDPLVLGEIWQIADTENRGFLTPAGFGMVLRLIGHVQDGRDPSPELAYKSEVKLFDGFPVPSGALPPSSPIAQHHSGAAGPIRVPPLTPEKAENFASFFEKSGTRNGLLPGNQAKDIFERARLPNDVLERIWNLVDTNHQGALGVTGFIVAMHLLTSVKSGAMTTLPTTLPPGLYEAAARRPRSRQGPAKQIPSQYSGSAIGSPQSPVTRNTFGPSSQLDLSAGNDWAVSPKDKAQFDGVFASLDRTNRGFITGEEAVRFFGNSNLPAEILAQVWDLSCINSNGQLNKDEFAVAMYLIRQQRGTRDGRGSLPSVLPPALVPPSMRRQALSTPQLSAPSFDNAPQNATKPAAEDLFGLDVLSSPAAPVPSQPQQTGGSDPFSKSLDASTPGGPSKTSSANLSASQSPHASIFKPFIPSSSFGQTMLTSDNTGGSDASGAQYRSKQPAAALNEDLLGDNDPEVSKRLTAETSELANLSNQVGTLSRQMQDVKTNRANTESELGSTSSQKREFEVRLSQLRSLYEKEVKDVRGLEERLGKSRGEIKRLQQEIAMVEGTYEDLQNQHAQALSALQADQQENAHLKERMRAVNTEIGELKPKLEKLKSEARQQKGLVAINKKQLATNEGERDKLREEISTESRVADERARSLSTASQVRSPDEFTSPALSVASHNTNPFFRRSPTANSERVVSPAPLGPDRGGASQNAPSAFEDVFGPTFPSETATPPPKTSFRSEPESRSPSSSDYLSAEPLHGSDGSGQRTPTETPPASVYSAATPSLEPPAPPASRQITSSSLPLRENLSRSDSMSSSVKVAAPASRYGGGGDLSGISTPTNLSVTTEENIRETTGPARTGDSPSQMDAAQRPAVQSRAQADSFHSFAPSASSSIIPGAFPGDATTSAVPTPTGEVSSAERSQDIPADPFPSGNNATPTSAKDDFDSAFAGFDAPKQASTSQTAAASSGDVSLGAGPAATTKVDKEFPPIQELGNDDESDSGSERGFDDDFTTSDPTQAHVGGGKLPSSGLSAGQVMTDALRPASSLLHSDSSSQLPTPGAQASPPPYDPSTSPGAGRKGSKQFPAEFTGLLPSRDDPLSPTGSPEQIFSGSKTGGQALFGSGSNSTPDAIKVQGAPTDSQPPAAPPKVPIGDDFDADFADLADAREADDRGDGDFDINARSSEGLDEFNPVFDSPAASRSEKFASGGAEHATNGFNDFGPSASGPPRTSSLEKAPQSQQAATPEDWDAIFAGLNEPSGNISGGLSGQLGAAPKATGEASASTSSQIQGLASSSSSSKRPAVLGRALSMGTEHDDPILKKLTGMGYPRDASLQALEKYDYNIDKVRDLVSPLAV